MYINGKRVTPGVTITYRKSAGNTEQPGHKGPYSGQVCAIPSNRSVEVAIPAPWGQTPPLTVLASDILAVES